MFVNIKVMRPLLWQPVFFILNFYASSCSSVSTFEYQSHLGAMPTSFRAADVTGRHSYALNFIENNRHDQLIKIELSY